LSSLAWIRATAIDDSIRDARQANEIAERLVSLEGVPPVLLLDIRSAAKAESGEFPSAIQLATEAIRALGDQQPKLRVRIEARIAGYRNERPFRDSNCKYP